jgi:hypothetical protein
VKKFVETEEPRNKCVAVTVPACEANRYLQPALRGGVHTAPATTVETIPATAAPLKK